MLQGESSSSNSSYTTTYHVFLSYGREGTHLQFTHHLRASLKRKGIIAFSSYDDKDHMIENSLAAIVVFSKSYASSTLCLDELEKIVETKRVFGLDVFTVFYDVTPSDVRFQKNSFGEAFGQHTISSGEDKLKMDKWRHCLHQVADLSGFESKNRHENDLIEDIIKSVWRKLHLKIPYSNDGLVGIDYRAKKLESILRMQVKDNVHFVGIWGMGGIGKTTLARDIFKKLRNEFEITCFLENVREIFGERDGKFSLQKTLLSHMNIHLKIEDLDERNNIIRDVFRNNKVLLVFDGVDDQIQLEDHVKKKGWFGLGSKIIITTRDKQILRSCELDEVYKMELLNLDESLQLFNKNAFIWEKPSEHHLELSKIVVQYSGGLPLALLRLASIFCGREESQWEEVLNTTQELLEIDDFHVMKTLRISYDGLPRIYKTLFLDIACFFNGWVKEDVIQILRICNRYPADGIEYLIDKSLASYDGLHLGMHGLLQEMGRKIVIEECIIDAGKRSRLWSLQDIDQVMKNNKAIELIQAQGIVLQSSTQPYRANWDLEAFSKMSYLQFLIINFHNMHLPFGLKCLCSSLKFLEWTEYPLESWPLNVQLNKLVHMKMHHSKILKIWRGDHNFAELKFIDLSHSKYLTQTPIVSGAPSLESLILEGCTSLVKVHKSVGKHKNLVILNMKDCKNLQTLPRKLKMDSLEELILSGCTKIKKLPKFEKNMKCLSRLSLEDCKNLLYLPTFICNMKSLKMLNISGCSKISKLLDNMNENESLNELYVNGTSIREITSSKVCLENLKELSFGGRKEQVSNSRNIFQRISKFRKQPIPMELILPPLSRLSGLKFLNLSHCYLNDESIPDNLGSISFLQVLDLSGNNFVNPPSNCICNLSMLHSLIITDCTRLESLPILPSNVQCLFTYNCPQLKTLNLDVHMLWQTFESHMNQKEDRPNFCLTNPGREIPTWFNNQKVDFIKPTNHPYNKLGCDTIASIKVEVSNQCQSSKWWGIAICLALEPSTMQQSSPPSHVIEASTCNYYWSCKDPNWEPDLDFPIGLKYGYHVNQSGDYPYTHIIFLSGHHTYIQHYLSGEKSQLEFMFYVDNFSKLGMPITINKCGCRVICKEDVENWCNILHHM